MRRASWSASLKAIPHAERGVRAHPELTRIGRDVLDKSRYIRILAIVRKIGYAEEHKAELRGRVYDGREDAHNERMASAYGHADMLITRDTIFYADKRIAAHGIHALQPKCNSLVYIDEEMVADATLFKGSLCPFVHEMSRSELTGTRRIVKNDEHYYYPCV